MGRPATILIALASCGRLGFEAVGSGDAAGDGPASARCSALAATCGPMANQPCCESPVVPGGMFYRSYDVATDLAYPDMGYPASLSEFRLDTYEVTVGRFRQFVIAGAGTATNPPPAGSGAHPNLTSSGWDESWAGSLEATTPALIAAVKCDGTAHTWTDAPAGNENLPMSCVTWYEAMAFCAWDGGYVPTEAEWNYAATAGSQQRAYPWSNPAGSAAIDCGLSNYGTCNGSPTSVGSRSPGGDGLWGQADLGGNVAEWVLDWYVVPYPTPCNDCANLIPASFRLVRGGAFDDTPLLVRAAYRDDEVPASNRYSVVGFRCARPP